MVEYALVVSVLAIALLAHVAGEPAVAEQLVFAVRDFWQSFARVVALL